MNSEAILPSKGNQDKNESLFFLGDIKNYQRYENTIEFHAENNVFFLEFLTDKLFRFKMGKPNEKLTHHSTDAILPMPGEKEPQINIKDEAEAFVIYLKEIKLIISKYPARISIYKKDKLLTKDFFETGIGWTSKKGVFCMKSTQKEERFYGFGEKTGFLNKKGTIQTMWNSDVFAPHNEETNALYQSIPFFINASPNGNYGILFDNSSKTTFDLSHDEYYTFHAEAGELDYYFFDGKSIKEILQSYTELTGKMPMLPKWSLGYQQSRYSYQTEEEVRRIAHMFRQKEIPCDAIYLDIHYMDEYRVFTWNPKHFEHHQTLISDLERMGFTIVPIVDPGVKIDPTYSIYQEMIDKKLTSNYYDGTPFTGSVWAGESLFPDFSQKEVRNWWGKSHSIFTQLGIKGIWNDMNEPSVFNNLKTMDENVVHQNDGNPKTHQEWHNQYGLNMSRATYEGMKELLNGERPFVVTRAGYAGIQRYAAVWTGDNRSFWEHLAMSIPMFLNMGLSGVPFVGADVGGFAHPTNGPLLVRWTQLGAFTPFFRNHCVIDAPNQEPWMFGEENEAIIKKYIELRYRLLPHFYNIMVEAHQTGLPFLRPLVLEYPNDMRTFNLSDELLVGDSILIAPVYRPDTEYKAVYLPEGKWINYWTNEIHEGNQDILVHAPLEIMPIFIKEGSIIAEGELKQHVYEKEDSTLTFHIYPKLNDKTEYDFYEDDGKTFDFKKGTYNNIQVSYIDSGEKAHLTLHYCQNQYKNKREKFIFSILTDKIPERLKCSQEINYTWKDKILKIEIEDRKEDIDIQINFE